MPNVRWDDPQTSYDALDVIAPKITDMHRRLLGIFERVGAFGATPWELQCETGIIYNTVWRRLSELKDYGVIVNTMSTRPNDRAFQETVVVLREYMPEGAYTPPKGARNRLQMENQQLREENELLGTLLMRIYARWKQIRKDPDA